MPNSNATKSDDWLGDLLVGTVTGVFSFAWKYRVEAALLSATYWLVCLLGTVVSDGLALTVALLVTGFVLATRRGRRWVFHQFYKARLRRKFEKACKYARVTDEAGPVPKLYRATKIAAGDRLLVGMPRGWPVSDLENAAERLASALSVREVRVERDPSNASIAHVTIARCDPLEMPEPLPWPNRKAPGLSLWEPIPVGIDENGIPVQVSLPERNVLIGGEPGAGKSAALSMLVATAALDPSVKLWLLDGKRVELATWAKLAERCVGPSIDEAIEVLTDLQTEMERRYENLLSRGLRKVPDNGELPLQLVVCDELAFYLTNSDRKKRTEFADLMRDLVSRGRAAGIVVVAATQKPSHDIIPTSLRDLFGFRWALRCNTPQASDTILGTGWATAGFDAATIPGSQRGTGYLHKEDERPLRLRSYYITDDDLEVIADWAYELRNQARFA